jgi:hypothetical protein
VSSANFNKDGKLDLAVASFDNNTLGIWLGNGDGTFQNQMEYSTDFAPTSMVVGDFNNDAKLDMVVATIDDSILNVLIGNGDGTFQNQTTYSTSYPVMG